MFVLLVGVSPSDADDFGKLGFRWRSNRKGKRYDAGRRSRGREEERVGVSARKENDRDDEQGAKEEEEEEEEEVLGWRKKREEEGIEHER